MNSKRMGGILVGIDRKVTGVNMVFEVSLGGSLNKNYTTKKKKKKKEKKRKLREEE